MDKLSAIKFMIGIYSAPKNYNKCNKCGGIGARHITCCSGSDCGCMGKPTDYIDCDCGVSFPSDEQILKWYNNANEEFNKTMAND